MADTSRPKYYRILVRFPDHDITAEAWQSGVVGIWYGAWTAEDFATAEGTDDPVGFIRSLPNQTRLKWDGFPKAYFNIGSEFASIKEGDWVYSYFDDCLHMGNVTGDLQSVADHKWNFDGEVFKYRLIKASKSFSLSALPDSFRLLTMVGRGGLNKVPPGTHEELIGILARSVNEEEAKNEIAALPWKDWIRILGPKSWEALCLAYLIRREGFVPAGLDIGRTMGTFDLVGRDSKGRKIFAQCKKHPVPMEMEEAFRKSVRTASDIRYLYFAYGGCTEQTATGVEIFSRGQIEDWLDHDRQYLDWLRS